MWNLCKCQFSSVLSLISPFGWPRTASAYSQLEHISSVLDVFIFVEDEQWRYFSICTCSQWWCRVSVAFGPSVPGSSVTVQHQRRPEEETHIRGLWLRWEISGEKPGFLRSTQSRWSYLSVNEYCCIGASIRCFIILSSAVVRYLPQWRWWLWRDQSENRKFLHN